MVDQRVTVDELWDLPYDSTHPGDRGYQLYAEVVWDAYLKAVEAAAVCRLPESTIHRDHYMSVDRFALTEPKSARWLEARCAASQCDRV